MTEAGRGLVQPVRNKEDIERMTNELRKGGTRNALLWRIGINSGLRVSDILTLKVRDVRDADYCTLKEQKTGKTRRFCLKAVRDEINTFVQGMDDDAWLFPSRKGDKPITRVQAYRILNDAAARCGLDEVGTHTMRKTFGYHQYKRNPGDLVKIQKLLNHSSQSVTLRYIGIEQDELDEMMEALNL